MYYEISFFTVHYERLRRTRDNSNGCIVIFIPISSNDEQLLLQNLDVPNVKLFCVWKEGGFQFTSALGYNRITTKRKIGVFVVNNNRERWFENWKDELKAISLECFNSVPDFSKSFVNESLEERVEMSIKRQPGVNTESIAIVHGYYISLLQDWGYDIRNYWETLSITNSAVVLTTNTMRLQYKMYFG